MLSIYIIYLSPSIVFQASLIPSSPPWSAYQIGKQNILQTQTFPYYTWSHLKIVYPTFSHSLSVLGTETDYIEKHSAIQDVPLERFGDKSERWAGEMEMEVRRIA